MRFPSLDTLWNAARGAFTRFPAMLVCAIVAAVAAVVSIEQHDSIPWNKVFLSAQLGIPLMFAIVVGAEGRGWSPARRWAATGVGLVALVGYGLTLPWDFPTMWGTRHAQFTVGLHLLVAFIPFTIAAHTNAFWQYNRALFTRFCVAVLYSAVLCGGLELALLGVDRLLGVNVREELYFHLFATIGVVVNTWVFVGGVPRDILGLESDTEYPRGLKVFAQYILVPIVIIYMAILLAYLGKIVVTTVWPSGWIGWMVSIVAVVGIFAHLLVHPVREGQGNQWIRSYGRWYYATMIPAAVMLLLAVGKRIDQYGITENRYILAVLGAWLAGLSVYFLVKSSRNIKVVPITLCVIAFATSFGPWGAFSVSYSSQMGRLEALLERNDVLVDGVIVPTDRDVPFEDRREISAVLNYVTTTHGVDRIQPLFGERWAQVDSAGVVSAYGKGRPGHDRVARLMEGMGLPYVEHWASTNFGREQVQYLRDPEALVYDLERADIMVRAGNIFEPAKVGGTGRSLQWSDSTSSFFVIVDADTLALDMASWLKGARLELGDGFGKLHPLLSRVSAENASVRLVADVEDVRWEIRDGEPHIVTIQAFCYITWLD